MAIYCQLWLEFIRRIKLQAIVNIVACICILFTCAACEVLTVFPIAHKDDCLYVDKLTGKWTIKSGGYSSRIVIIDYHKDRGNYTISSADKDGRMVCMQGCVVKIGDSYYASISTDLHALVNTTKSKLAEESLAFMMPVYCLIKIEVNGDEMTIYKIDLDQERIPAGMQIARQSPDDKSLLSFDSTERWRNLIMAEDKSLKKIPYITMERGKP